METEDFRRMSDIYATVLTGDDATMDAVPEADRDYFINRLTPFTQELIEQAISFLVNEYGVPRDMAITIIVTTTMASKMSGATSFRDFMLTERLAQG
jgi:hypothetical protein